MTMRRGPLLAKSVVKEASDNARFGFLVEWKDVRSNDLCQYQLMYYPQSSEIEMHEIKKRRLFLRRTKFTALCPQHLSIGSHVTILSRQLKIVGYADEHTRLAFQDGRESACVLINDTDVRCLSHFIKYVASEDLQIREMKVVELTPSQKDRIGDLVILSKNRQDTLSGRLVIFEVEGKDAGAKVRAFNPVEESGFTAASPVICASLEDTHGSRNSESRRAFVSFCQQLSSAPLTTAPDSTLALIKPHAVRSGSAGDVLESINDDFCILNICAADLSNQEATEFYSVYGDALTPGEFTEAVEALAAGVCIALQINRRTVSNESSLQSLRLLCGPADPELCRLVKPDSLRARYGISKALNAIHCTDLEEDRDLELNFMFGVSNG